MNELDVYRSFYKPLSWAHFFLSLGIKGTIALFLLFGIMLSLFFVVNINEHKKKYNALMAPVIKAKSQEASSPIVDNQIEPELPSEEDNNETITGVDSDNDGLRDDVEIWINHTTPSRNVRLALKQYATELGKTYRVGSLKDIGKAMDESVVIKHELENTLDCMLIVIHGIHDKDSHYFSEALEEIMFNTEDRRDLYSKYLNRLSNISYTIEGSSLRNKKNCKFEIDN